MIPAQAKLATLELADEDWIPLFDVTSVIRFHMRCASEAEQIRLAQCLVRELLLLGYIELQYDCDAKSTEDERFIEKLSTSEYEVELEDLSNWVPHERRGPDRRWVTIGATPQGQEALFKGVYFAN